MPTKKRIIRKEQETVNVFNNGFPYAVKNINHVQEDMLLAFAYRKAKGDDNRIRVVLELNDAIIGKYLGVFLIDAEYGSSTQILAPSPLDFVSSIGWTLDRNFQAWLEDEYYNKQTFSEGQTYTFKRYSIELLNNSETDLLSQCLLLVNSNESSGLRY